MNYKSGERVGQQASQQQQDRSASNRTRSSSLPYDNNTKAASYIHMNDSQSLTGGGGGGAPHGREDSGYTQSTIGFSVPPMATIGIKRGTDILRSRPYGSEPPNVNGGDEHGISDPRMMPRFDEDDVDVEAVVDNLGVPYFFGPEQTARDRESELERSLSAAGGDADNTHDLIKADRNFYLLSAKNGQKGHVLSAEALAGEFRQFLM